MNYKEAHQIQCVLLNVLTQQKVGEWSNATGPPLYLPYSLHLNGQLFVVIVQELNLFALVYINFDGSEYKVGLIALLNRTIHKPVS